MQSLDEVNLSNTNELTMQMLSAQTPKVFRQLVSDWPIVALKTDPEKVSYMLSKSAGKVVPAWVADKKEGGRFFYNSDMSGFNFERQRLPFNDVLRWLMANASDEDIATVYMGSTSVDMLMPLYREHNDIALLKDSPLVSLWTGNRSRVAAHFDATDNVACVLAGARKFTLFPPDQWDNLYVGPIEFNPAGQAISLVDFKEPDLARFPNFAHALEQGFEVTLYPGDAIYIPSMWWHHVEALSSFNLLQNYWWRQAPEPAGNPTDALIHAMLSIKDLPLAQRNAWRDIFENMVFSPKQHEHIAKSARGFTKTLDSEQAAKMRKILKQGLDL
ncbi:cupin-like domain-containing protein [Glaciecola siphonariae]|uniref:Cupin-like domain-containing protein n=1 Tax=Glaciecola siphonariae TaxID=521012 RepID=A0ABV9LXC8_9ALTE